YTDVFDSFCSLLASHSPQAYKTFHHHFGGRTLRSMRDLRFKQPLFEPGFSEKNIARAAETIRRLKYDGPLALSWDDTDLEKALATWKDSDGLWIVLGAAQGPMQVTSIEDVDHLIQDLDAKIDLADKVCYAAVNLADRAGTYPIKP
ncbi:hypothetical protein PAXINDRAFT_83149, partial [Paxillus involutus ATCC 200175]